MKKFASFGLALLFLGMLPALEGCVGCTHVDAGNVGVEIDSCANGGINKTPVGVGFHTTGPCTTIVEYPTYQQMMQLAGEQAVHVTSSEGLPIAVEATIAFTVDAGRVPEIYAKYRKSLQEVEDSYFHQAAREALQETTAKFTAQELYSDKRETTRALVQGLLTKKLGAEGFNINQFTINKTQVPDAVLNAIQQKVAMVQQAQQAEQAVKKTQAEAEQNIAKARGEAESIKLRADAQAYANQKLASSLSPVLVDYKRIEKWDGRMPQYSGAGTPLINVGNAAR